MDRKFMDRKFASKLKFDSTFGVSVLEEMCQYNKSPDDIEFIGTFDGKFYTTWEDFIDEALYITDSFDPRNDLVIKFKDGSMMIAVDFETGVYMIYIPPVKLKQNAKKLYTIRKYIGENKTKKTLSQVYNTKEDIEARKIILEILNERLKCDNRAKQKILKSIENILSK